MAESRRVQGDRVYCHVCNHEWDRAHGGLQCPACESEFVEILDPTSRSAPSSPAPMPSQLESPQHIPNPHILHHHNPWAPDPEEDDITTFEFNTGGGGRGTFSMSSRTYTFGGPGGMRTSTSGDMASNEIHRNFELMLGNIMGLNQRRRPNMMGGFFEFPSDRVDRGFRSPHSIHTPGSQPGQHPGQPPDLFSMLFQGVGPRHNNQMTTPFELFGALLNPGNARHGDTVFSQEAFDRIMTQLMEQNSSNAPGPASDSAIAALRKKPVDESMMGSDGKAECSICMDNLEIGDEVTFLPCNHWFHGDCVISWLREHDTCPHCRQPITNAADPNDATSPSRRRRSHRRSSSAAGPRPSVVENNNSRDASTADSQIRPRDERPRFYSSSQSFEVNTGRPSRERRPSERDQRSGESEGGGGVTGWIRSRLPFSGQ